MARASPWNAAELLHNASVRVRYWSLAANMPQLARNAVQSVTSFSLTPIPFFVLMGEVLFHSGVALKAIDDLEASFELPDGDEARGEAEGEDGDEP